MANLTVWDIELVVVGGRVQVVSEANMSTASSRRSWTAAVASGIGLRWVRAPLGHLFREAERALGCEIKIGGKRVRHVSTAWFENPGAGGR